MAIPEIEMARVRRSLQVFCDRVPPHAREQVWYDWRVRGNQVTLAEKRPAWWSGAGPDEVTVSEFARFQYNPETQRWMLKGSDRNGRFHPYEGLEQERSFERLVEEVEADPIHIFFG